MRHSSRGRRTTHGRGGVAWTPRKAAPTRAHSKQLRSRGAGDAVFEEGDELMGIAGGRETRLAGADYGEGLACGEMRKSFLESAGETELWRFRSDAENGFAEADEAVGGGF